MKIITPKDVIIYEDGNGKQPFEEWRRSLDMQTKQRVNIRIVRMQTGNFGDHKLLQQGIYELRLIFGAGYRVYCANDGDKVVVLLSGGDKSTQKSDIKKATMYWKEYKERKYG